MNTSNPDAPAPRRVPRSSIPPSTVTHGTLFLPCAAGTEPWLVEECLRLLDPGTVVEAGRGGVYVDGGLHDAMRLNLGSRLAQRVLWQVAEGPYASEHDLYDMACRVRWSDWITPRQTLRVDASAWRSPLQSLNFAALRIKDAVCDVMRHETGERPSVDTRFPDLALTLHVGPGHASLSVDLSGEALFKRGWREVKGEAPLKETLAAAMLAAAGWQGRPEDGGLLDPCCGAGTIPIEAAQMACQIAPGLGRRFAFERLLPFRDQQSAWRQLREEAQDRIRPAEVPIWAGDVSFRMTDFATRNAERAGVLQAIEFKTA
ncbi:THUMP domain-containing class I SAM-dependent RNA methyltransferase, partial [Ideonella sp.]|uniref:THUMP domain-containing class I SAM-dependent RNA methyltransferase n=1 Tax=Ideonella sp. TaxID=1929293 RepID=UPI003BB4B87A